MQHIGIVIESRSTHIRNYKTFWREIMVSHSQTGNQTELMIMMYHTIMTKTLTQYELPGQYQMLKIISSMFGTMKIANNLSLFLSYLT